MKDNKKRPNILRDALSLFLITLISGLALSFVYEMTKAPIEKQAMAKKMEAYEVVYPEAKLLAEDEELMQLLTETDLSSLNASYKGVTIEEINKALDSSENHIGYIIKVSINGYKDVITTAIGLANDGTIQGIELLAINETPGLGMIAAEPDFKNQFANKNVELFEVTKSGASEDHQINAISGATITTDAVVNSINAGIGFVTEFADLGGGANE